MSPQDPSTPQNPANVPPPNVPPTDPTTNLPVTPPPAGGQLPPPGAPGNVTPGAHQPSAPSSGGSGGLWWKVATGVLALTTIGFAIWGYTATKNLNDSQAAADAQIASMQKQIANLETQESDVKKVDAEKMKAAKQRFEEVKGNLKLEKRDLKQADGQIDQLHANYTKLQQQAAAEDASLKDRLSAAQAETALAKGCSAVLAAGLDQIYIDVPDGVTFHDVARALKDATDKCSGVVTLETP